MTAIESNSLDETRDIGRRLGGALRVGDVVGLVGPLGAGKTALVKGIAEGIGVADPHRVTSPTFVIVNEYEGRVHLHHIDAYRLGTARELEALGLEEFVERGVVVVEWADRVEAALPADRLTITIEPTGEQQRTMHLSAPGGRAVELARALGR